MRIIQCAMPTLEELGIRFVAFSPLGKGFLTGPITEETMSGLGPIADG